MNCGKCGRVLYAGMTKCFCGTKVPGGAIPQPRMTIELTDNQSSRAYAAKKSEVDRYVENYRHENQGCTKREACLAYMTERGLIGTLRSVLPGAMKKEIDQEAIAEREAIQAEGA